MDRFSVEFAVILTEIEALKVEAMGMHAENMQRAALGESMAYGNDHFESQASAIREQKEKLSGLYDALLSNE